MPQRLRIAWILLLTVAGIGAVLYSLLVPGPFNWHVELPEVWQGGLEIAVVLAWTWAALSLATRTAWRAALVLPMLALYLRRHHVDLELLVTLLYFEGLFALGVLFVRDAAQDAWLRRLVAGVAMLSLVLWLAQLAGWGLPRTQRVLAFALLLPAVAWRFKSLESIALLGAAFRDPQRNAHPWIAGLLLAPCVLMAHSNVVLDSDSLWYSFRPERVLVGENSVFDFIGMVSPVHYFPKLYEVLTLPLAAAQEITLMQAPGIAFGALLARLVFTWLRELGHDRVTALAGAALAWSIPAFSNVSLGAKPDVFAALMVVAMAWFCWRFQVTREARTIPWLLSCAALAVGAKLAVIPYVGAMGTAFLVLLARNLPARTPLRELDGLWPMTAAAAVLLLVSARTVVLAGMPTVGPEQLVTLWNALGMTLKFPVGTLEWTDALPWRDIPRIAAGWALDPTRFSHLQISWPGNVWWLLPLAAVFAPRALPATSLRWLLWLLPGTALLMLVTIAFVNEGGDGNYFLAPVVLATIGALDFAFSRLRMRALRGALFVSLALFVAFHGAYSLVSAGWGPGTRAWDLHFGRDNRDQRARDEAALMERGLAKTADHLRNAGSRMRVVGRGGDNRLPARYQEIENLLYAHWQQRSPQLLEEVLACARAEAYLLRPAADESPYPEIAGLERRLRALPPDAVLHAEPGATLLSLRGVLPRCTR